jgi:hypothetical protein
MSMDQLTSALFYVQFVMNASFDVSDQYSRIQEALGSATQVRNPSSLILRFFVSVVGLAPCFGLIQRTSGKR